MLIGLVKTAIGEGGIELREVPKPRVRPGHVLIEPEAVGVCGSDLARYTGKLLDYEPPVILGHEFCGTIAEVGENVTRFTTGDRVVCETHGTFCGTCYFCMTGQHALCSARKGFGYGVDGAFTEYVLARPEIVHLMPSRLSFDECAATEPLCVAIHAVTDRVRLKPGDTIAIFGMGPVGLLALQAAKLYAPSKIIAIDLTENIRLKMAADLGANHTVACDKEEVTSKIFDYAGREGVDASIDAAGSTAALRAALKVTRKSGQILVIGQHPKLEEIAVGEIVMRQLSMSGSWSHTWANWETALKLLEEGKVSTKPLITHTYPLTDWKKAFETLLNLEAVKAVLKVHRHS
jgi:alcohol dehydrogenase/L-iditol 2-dehydrogenase